MADTEKLLYALDTKLAVAIASLAGASNEIEKLQRTNFSGIPKAIVDLIKIIENQIQDAMDAITLEDVSNLEEFIEKTYHHPTKRI
jgi:hypothetical protein